MTTEICRAIPFAECRTHDGCIGCRGEDKSIIATTAEHIHRSQDVPTSHSTGEAIEIVLPSTSEGDTAWLTAETRERVERESLQGCAGRWVIAK